MAFKIQKRVDSLLANYREIAAGDTSDNHLHNMRCTRAWRADRGLMPVTQADLYTGDQVLLECLCGRRLVRRDLPAAARADLLSVDEQVERSQ